MNATTDSPADSAAGAPIPPTSFPKSRIGVTLLENIHPDGTALFTEQGFPVDQRTGAASAGELGGILETAHLIGIRSKTQLTPELIERAPKLLAIGCFCIGTNQVALDAAGARGIPVFNAPFSNTRSVAELTIAEIVALHRRLGDRSAEVHAGVWNKSAAGAHEIRGRTLGIIGYGHIGAQVSVMAEAMGMRVLFHDIQAKLALGNASQAASLDDLLERSDVVTLHIPATATTERLIGAAELAKMKPGAYLINNARGSVVDVDALAGALRDGSLGGAAVDVFPAEPGASGPGFESPLCGAPNTILTPHIGGSTAEAQAAIARDVGTKMLRFVNNGSTTGAVNVPEVDLPEQAGPFVGSAGPAGRDDDGAPRAHRLLHFHRNVPGVLSEINRVLSDAGVNVAAQYLRTAGELGYVVLDVDPSDTRLAADRLDDIEHTIRTRVLW